MKGDKFDRMAPTPGPWTAEEPFAGKVSGPAVWADGMLVAQMAGRGTFDDANARLIAASPDLLAACRAAFKALKADDPFTGSDWELGHRLSAAIGKATDPDYPS